MANDHKDAKNIWFPAKKYGWGWGIPLTWQGWAVLAAYMALAFAGAAFIAPSRYHVWFLPYIFLISVLLVFICWKKGEKPQWRWGKKD